MAIRHKFGAIPVTLDGIKFHSTGEDNRYAKLTLLERMGEITDLKRQPVFLLGTEDRPVLIRSSGFPNGRRAKYVADFDYFAKNGDRIVEDYKGFDTPESRLKRAVVEAQYGIRILITGEK